MDILTFLEQDHDTAKHLIERFDAVEGDERVRLVEQLTSELEVHTQLEEQLFYPAVRSEVPDSDDIVVEGIEEHHVAKQLIDEIRALEPADEAWEAKVKVLGENVEHHIEEEQDEMFPKVREGMAEDRRLRLGSDAQRVKHQLLFEAMTVIDLREQAKDAGVTGASGMTKAELVETLVETAVGASSTP
jgi:iron-sulfur cluster repair protein YtfE (RIC family)